MPTRILFVFNHRKTSGLRYTAVTCVVTVQLMVGAMNFCTNLVREMETKEKYITEMSGERTLFSGKLFLLFWLRNSWEKNNIFFFFSLIKRKYGWWTQKWNNTRFSLVFFCRRPRKTSLKLWSSNPILQSFMETWVRI